MPEAAYVASTSPVAGAGSSNGSRRSGPRLAFGEALRTSFSEITAHWLRSFLTLIGVFLGSLAVVIMVSFAEALKVMVWQGIKSLGYNGVMFISEHTPEMPMERKKATMSRGLGVRDVKALAEWGEGYEGVAAMSLTQTVVRALGQERRVWVFGVNPAYAKVRNRTVSAGRWIDGGDELERRKVAVVGRDLGTTLFGTDNPIGKQIRVADQVLRVIGVGDQLGNTFANDGGDSWTQREMEGVIIPLETFRAYIRGGERIGVIMIKTPETENLGAVRSETERLMRRAHHGIGDFEVEDVASEIVRAEAQIKEVLRSWTVILTSLAAISLLVGGVGIYSVMKISLTERLYEIGLRKAIGAGDRTILLQFLIESSTLSALGGMLGCGVGIVLCQVLARFFPTGLPVSPLGLALGIGFAVAVGLFAGVFPSLSAARLTPVEALRG
jgi:putative ABC transport system permease protein